LSRFEGIAHGEDTTSGGAEELTEAVRAGATETDHRDIEWGRDESTARREESPRVEPDDT
jgi:hypothetical protein